MATIYQTGSREAACIECGATGTLVTSGGTNTTWGDEYDDDSQRTQHTDALREGSSFECHACGYADGEPPMA